MSEATKKRGGPDVFMSVWRRRKWLALSTLAVIVCAAASVAVFLPDLYRGTATVLVERPDVTESLVRPGEADELETRLQTIEEKLLSRARLEDLIQRFNLYRGQRTKGASTEAIIEQMRRDIRLEPRGVDPTVGHGATVSFALSYWGDNPRTAAEVANTLAASYVEDNLKSREHQAASSARFLKAELDEAKARLDESSEAQARLVGRRDGLVKRLASMEPAGGPRAAGVARLAKLREELTELRTRYKDSHPLITQAQSEIQAIESQIAGSAPKDRSGPADSGAVQRIREELAQADAGLMSSDYATAKDRYLSLVKWYEEARLNESMEQEQQGVQFAILDPAVVPDKPASPNRFRILLGGLAISVGLALGAIVLAERMDTSFHALDDLKEFTRVPVLASIPRIVTKKGKRQRRYRVFLGVSLALLGLPFVVGVSYFIARWGGSYLLMIIGGRA
ncbi:MAG TPA: Wzz/FepE/Etk N-terminal domain-containing protein [Candidatus Polarisedimenticolia bacterium]|nr:Wzz/FepE/Etk N-terminal domain-containing protein [Candidatus Polarisedimenticolia bacterium]